MSKSLVPFRVTVPTQLDSLFDSLFQEFWTTPAFLFERNWRPTDIQETDEGYKIEIELPRVRREQITVEVTDGVLLVSAKTDKLSFARSFRLLDADVENAKVALSDGVLTIDVSKIPSTKPRKLEIK